MKPGLMELEACWWIPRLRLNEEWCHGKGAGGGRVGDECGRGGELVDHFALATRAGEPGGACANASRLSREAVVFCRGTTVGRASSDSPTLHRAGAGLWTVDGAR